MRPPRREFKLFVARVTPLILIKFSSVFQHDYCNSDTFSTEFLSHSCKTRANVTTDNINAVSSCSILELLPSDLIHPTQQLQLLLINCHPHLFDMQPFFLHLQTTLQLQATFLDLYCRRLLSTSSLSSSRLQTTLSLPCLGCCLFCCAVGFVSSDCTWSLSMSSSEVRQSFGDIDVGLASRESMPPSMPSTE